MSTSDVPAITPEIERQLHKAESQLALYARDLKRTVDSERKKARQLAEANARLEVLNRLKTDFLSFIAHELRTPLSTMAMVELFDPQADSKDQADLIEIIRGAYEYLDQFVRKGLEYFRWLAQERVDSPETADLEDVVRQVADRTSGLKEPGVDFRISSHGGPFWVRMNGVHLAEVVKILLDNALKFSLGEKFIRIDLAGTAERVTLVVTDHGVGIAPSMTQEVFHPFTIADIAHHSGGTGLNLAIASVIVGAYSGRIRAESKGAGKGATFIVELPALVPSAETAAG